MTWPTRTSVNAWIYLQEDDPSGSIYSDPESSFQSAIRSGVYESVDWLGIAFFLTVQADSGWTIAWPQKVHHSKFSGKTMTNAEYLKSLVRDTRAANPDILLVTTMLWGQGDTLNNIFTGPEPPAGYASQFAQNLVAYLDAHDLDGIDIDWEYPLSDDTTQQNLDALLPAIRTAFDAHEKATGRRFYLTLSPVTAEKLTPSNVVGNVDLLNLQIYGGTTPQSYTSKGIPADLLAYGAKFESAGPGDPAPYQTAQQAYEGYAAGSSPGVPYSGVTTWRLNSGNFQSEQAQQIILRQLVDPPKPPYSFDDAVMIATAGNPPITGLTIRSGEVLDAIQATSTGSFQGAAVTYTTALHGGTGGTESSVQLHSGETLTKVTGSTGNWFGRRCVVQITLHTSSGRTLGPYGSMQNVTSPSAFTLEGQAGESLVAFRGTVIQVPLASGHPTNIVESLEATFATT